MFQFTILFFVVLDYIFQLKSCLDMANIVLIVCLIYLLSNIECKHDKKISKEEKHRIEREKTQKCRLKNYPFYVSIQSKINGVFNHHCGGSLIQEEVVLTSAFCCKVASSFLSKKFKIGDLRIVGGVDLINRSTKFNKLKTNRLGVGEQQSLVKKIIPHDDYMKTLNADICIMITKNYFNNSYFVEPAKVEQQPMYRVACRTGMTVGLGVLRSPLDPNFKKV